MTTTKIEDLILYGAENPSLDFKKEQYPIEKGPRKHELLKDISAMANHPDNSDKYIIIGIKNSSDGNNTYHPIEKLHDEAQYQQYVESNLEPHINFEYRSYLHKGEQLAYFRIFNNSQRPYLFKCDVSSEKRNEYKLGDGFIRVGSSTRRLKRDDFEKIYRDRYSSPDRKSEVSVNCYLMKATLDVLGLYNFNFIDMSIKNNSTQSIIVGVELKFKKPSESFTVMRRHEAIEYIRQEESLKNQYVRSINDHLTPSFMTTIYGYNGVYILELKNNITISQSKRIHDIFSKDLVIVGAKSGERIEGEITVRSDSFPSGPLVHPFQLVIP
jgi:hypothetical protein